MGNNSRSEYPGIDKIIEHMFIAAADVSKFPIVQLGKLRRKCLFSQPESVTRDVKTCRIVKIAVHTL
ncbi:hypothetical protein YP76_05725 [Sphingobium chungbukense]|uniref:Uncharacterized protein n=1 Tax=Sphingobium chungbukense TaxID=56193 RepID=A0A0M3ASB6_9SPHN|nr:hypothetical protein YP76_05725 [Sphingobium chungbukense]